MAQRALTRLKLEWFKRLNPALPATESDYRIGDGGSQLPVKVVDQYTSNEIDMAAGNPRILLRNDFAKRLNQSFVWR